MRSISTPVAHAVILTFGMVISSLLLVANAVQLHQELSFPSSTPKLSTATNSVAIILNTFSLILGLIVVVKWLHSGQEPADLVDATNFTIVIATSVALVLPIFLAGFSYDTKLKQRDQQAQEAIQQAQVAKEQEARNIRGCWSFRTVHGVECYPVVNSSDGDFMCAVSVECQTKTDLPLHLTPQLCVFFPEEHCRSFSVLNGVCSC